jgi:hypothetical protein
MDADKKLYEKRRLSAFLGGLISFSVALVGYFWFPGHTWLQQDSQLYVPILEHQRDPAVLRNDPVALEPHTAYTLYDETAVALSRLTGQDFHTVLAVEQIATRALGIWGLWLIATAAGLSAGPAWLVAMAVALGASIKGPEVLTFEYEPTPRAMAVPLVFLAIGLAAHRRMPAAAVAGACAFLFHPPAALPFWAVFAAMNGRKWTRLLPLAGAIALLLLTGGGQTHQPLFGRIAAFDEQLLRMRTGYVLLSMWPARVVWHYVVLTVVLAAAWWRVRGHGLLMALAAIGLAAMPVSWLLLENSKLRLVAELQPMRWLLYTTVAMQILAGIAGVRALSRPLPDGRAASSGSVQRAFLEALGWFFVLFILPLQPVLTRDFTWQYASVAIALAALACAGIAWKFAPAAGLAAFVAVPLIGGVVNYPRLHTPEMARLVEWARTSTPRDAVFLFPGAGRSMEPGIFRAEAQRALYVDWKSGGQMIYLPDFGRRWWFRWEQARQFDLAKYAALGISYAVVKQGGDFVVYDTHTGTPARQSR